MRQSFRSYTSHDNPILNLSLQQKTQTNLHPLLIIVNSIHDRAATKLVRVLVPSVLVRDHTYGISFHAASSNRFMVYHDPTKKSYEADSGDQRSLLSVIMNVKLIRDVGGVDIDCPFGRLMGRNFGELRNLLVDIVLGGSTATTEHLLDLSSVVASVLLANGSDLLGLLLSNVSNLGSLGFDNIDGVLEVVVDQFFVVNIDQRSQEGHKGANDSKTPVRDNLGEVVGQESKDGSLEPVSFLY